MSFHHTSVLLRESVDNLVVNPDGIYVDCTLGGAGHAMEIAQRLTNKGVIIGFDQDKKAIETGRDRLSKMNCTTHLILDNFVNLKEELHRLNIKEVDGFLFDLGVSSYQLDTPERGFSYMHSGPLDMRMDMSSDVTAETIVNQYSVEDIHRIIKDYGEERWSKRIATFIGDARKMGPIETTDDLVNIIKRAIPAGARKDGPHPAKRTFQALRIEVNKELSILQGAFKDAINCLKPKGRICVITFHSLEDRITKVLFKELSKGCICPPELPVCVCHHEAVIKIKGKVIEPSAEEVVANPRSRSAKLRVAEKI